MEGERIGPLSNVVAYWDYGLDGYPTRVRLAMSDGTIQTFLHEVKQPAPNVVSDYKPKHLKEPEMLQHLPTQSERLSM